MENESELDLNLDLDQIEVSADKQLQVKNRIQKLANDKRDLAQQKEQAEAQAKAAEEAKALAEKNLEFYKNFSQLSSKHPEAVNYQDQILERVNKGYDAEEATLAVLAKEGKLGTTQAPQPKVPNPEGGSAMTPMQEGDKPLDDLSTNEKLEKLKEMEKDGSLIQAIKSGINIS